MEDEVARDHIRNKHQNVDGAILSELYHCIRYEANNLLYEQLKTMKEVKYNNGDLYYVCYELFEFLFRSWRNKDDKATSTKP